MITTSELTAHLEGTFKARRDIAERRYFGHPTEENLARLEEANETWNTIYGIVYEFNEANTGA